MRALKPALSAAFIVLMMGFSTPSQAQQTFTLQLCNKYTAPVKVALVFMPQPRQFVSKGWVPIESGKCAGGKLPLGPFAIFGFAGTPPNIEKAWGGDLKLCVNPSADFENVLQPNSRCKDNEAIAGFQAFDQPTQPTVALELN